MSVLREMTKVMMSVPGPGATPAEMAAWYERKARLLDRIAEEDDAGAEETRAQAAAARAHACALLDEAA